MKLLTGKSFGYPTKTAWDLVVSVPNIPITASQISFDCLQRRESKLSVNLSVQLFFSALVKYY